MREILIVLISLMGLNVYAMDDDFDQFCMPMGISRVNSWDNEFFQELAKGFGSLDPEIKIEIPAEETSKALPGLLEESLEPHSKKRKRSAIKKEILISVEDIPKPIFCSDEKKIKSAPTEKDMELLTEEQKSNIRRIKNITWQEKSHINTSRLKLQWILLYEYLGVGLKTAEENLRTQFTILRTNINFLEKFLHSSTEKILQDAIAKPVFGEDGKIISVPTETDMEGLTIEQKATY